jgi:hypothetical protein
MLPRVGNLFNKVPKRRKRPKMAKLPGGKTKKSKGKKPRPEHLPEGAGKATRLPLNEERDRSYPNYMSIPTNRLSGLSQAFSGQ